MRNRSNGTIQRGRFGAETIRQREDSDRGLIGVKKIGFNFYKQIESLILDLNLEF